MFIIVALHLGLICDIFESIWCEVGVQLFSFAYGYPVILELFVEKTFFPLLSGLDSLVENELTIFLDSQFSSIDLCVCIWFCWPVFSWKFLSSCFLIVHHLGSLFFSCHRVFLLLFLNTVSKASALLFLNSPNLCASLQCSCLLFCLRTTLAWNF